jgi:general secretion pathway protein A
LTGGSRGSKVTASFMYLSFFGLGEKPFGPTPDPRFLFIAASHREALDQVQERRGLVVLTGEPGTGKTALLLALCERLGAETAASFVFNTTLSFDGIVEFMLEDLGIAKPEESPARRLAALKSFLSEREQAGQRTTLIVDEAQHLDAPTLVQLGLLANLESATSSTRLQLLLAGSPELDTRLQDPDLRHLHGAIAARCRIRPLDAGEVAQYIHHRLEIAGAPDTGLFDLGAIGRLARFSGGIPRVINILADHCLMLAYADQRRRVDWRTADRAIADLTEGTQAPLKLVAVWTTLGTSLTGVARRLLGRRH